MEDVIVNGIIDAVFYLSIGLGLVSCVLWLAGKAIEKVLGLGKFEETFYK